MTVTATAGSIAAPTHTEVRSAGRLLNAAIVILLCAWVLVPIYLIIVNALSSPEDVTGWPKRAWPGFDFGSLSFFVNYAGVASALMNSVIVAVLTMILSIGLGAPAGLCAGALQFPRQGDVPPARADDARFPAAPPRAAARRYLHPHRPRRHADRLGACAYDARPSLRRS
jgi:hypothetical protein